MGNSGSAHNLHNNGVSSEINSYYTQQYLKRNSGAANNYNSHLHNASTTYNEVMQGGASVDRPVAAFKVLPKPTDSLKLRATTNGAILHAGGTISFRAKDSLDDRLSSSVGERENYPTVYPMRRSHTLIIDGYGEQSSQRKSAPVEFRRAQTLLHVGYNRTKSYENSSSSPKLDERKSRSTHNTTNGTGTTLKINKYNKKRKAPPAPTKTIANDNAITAKVTASESKPRIYATNINKSVNSFIQPQQQRQRQASTTTLAPFQRNCHIRNSANFQSPAQPNECFVTKLPYRREKSFDAVLLRQKDSQEPFERTSVQNTRVSSEREQEQHSKYARKTQEDTQRQTDVNRGKKLHRKPAKNVTSRISSKPNDIGSSEIMFPKNVPKEEAPKFRERTLQEKLPGHGLRPRITKEHNSDIQNKEIVANVAEKKTKVQQSRIPQLKRTFYFGMESTKATGETENSTNDNCNVQLRKPFHDKIPDEVDDVELDMHRHSLEVEEEIEDNGILVHVRPTLPRRQPETPSFSPAAAWRNLLEEQQRLQLERAKTQSISSSGNQFVESPICLISNTKDNKTTHAAWTPQQDLEDEEEEEADEKTKPNHTQLSSKIDLMTEKPPYANSLHIFSLSLPRDVHLQGQIKTSLNCSEMSTTGFKNANCWLVPGFNSLQKFKTTISGGVSSRINTKCTCLKGISKRNHNSQPNHVFQTIFGETFATDSCNHVAECELHKSLQSTPSSHNDNWVLHKSKANENSEHTTDTNIDAPYSPANRHSMVYIQPKSLTHVCGGKHVMYLPGQEACSLLNKEPISPAHNKSTTATFKRQRQRQEIARESLQDLTPVQDIQKSNARIPEKNTHRFSFQSTVRVLEKRRLAEKLSKDAEIQEAQRLHELEAMKRVEEDFQRKRAQEKANIRNQLRLHLNSNLENEDYRSLPLNINDRYEDHQQQSDTNNNIFCRAEPDGAVSPSPIFNDNPDKQKHYNFPLSSTKTTEIRRFDSDCDESEIETQLADFQRTALLIEPYLQSII